MHEACRIINLSYAITADFLVNKLRSRFHVPVELHDIAEELKEKKNVDRSILEEEINS